MLRPVPVRDDAPGRPARPRASRPDSVPARRAVRAPRGRPGRVPGLPRLHLQLAARGGAGREALRDRRPAGRRRGARLRSAAARRPARSAGATASRGRCSSISAGRRRARTSLSSSSTPSATARCAAPTSRSCWPATGRSPAARNAGVRDLGYLDAAAKAAAYAAAAVVCQPSVNESFSIVLMEAWLAGTPVLVHARCPVTTHHVFQAGGGLAFDDFYEFAEALDLLLEDRQRRTGSAARAAPTSRPSTAGPRDRPPPRDPGAPRCLTRSPSSRPGTGPTSRAGPRPSAARRRGRSEPGRAGRDPHDLRRDHASPWVDHHPDGVTEEDGFVVRRFKVRPRIRAVRAAPVAPHLGGTLTSFEEEDFVRESVNSNDLYAYLALSATGTGTRSYPTASAPPGRGRWSRPSARS